MNEGQTVLVVGAGVVLGSVLLGWWLSEHSETSSGSAGIVKGTNVSFDLEDGREIYAPVSSGMMHDPSGSRWPRCSVLIGPFRRTGRSVKDDRALEYFGKNYRQREGIVDAPPRKLGGWRSVGEVERIWYERPGTKYPGYFKHRFNSNAVSFLFGKQKVRLYKFGRFYRLELPKGCTLDDRGFVHP